MPACVRSILVVDDESDVRDAIAELLSDKGFRVSAVADGWQALDRVNREPFDLIIADIGLPQGLNGLQMMRLARERRPGLKCLFISGLEEPIVCDPKLDEFVAKPFRLFELLGCVWKVLQGNTPYTRVAVARPRDGF